LVGPGYSSGEERTIMLLEPELKAERGRADPVAEVDIEIVVPVIELT
jgi:hypothetical protein